jgi:drug/metabolite transporter (DMT)-like permease
VAAVMLGAAVPWSGLLHDRLSARAVAAALFLGIFCSGAAFLLWYAALREHGAARTGSYLYLEPFVTVGVSSALLGEPIAASVIAGGCLVLAGVWAVARWSARPAADIVAPPAEAT